MKKVFTVIFLLFLVFSFSKTISINKIKEDLDVLKTTMIEKHGDFFAHYNKEDFINDIEILKNDLKNLDIYSLNYSIQEILAKADDGHTEIAGIFNSGHDESFPYELVYYDGVYVRALPKKFEKYLGWKVDSINYVNIDEIIKKVDRLSNEDNIYGLKKNFKNIINKVHALKYLDIADKNQVILSLEKNREKINIVVNLNDKEKTYLPRYGWLNDKGNQNQAFWLSNIGNIDGGLYFQYNKCFSKEMFEKMKNIKGYEDLAKNNLDKYPSVEEIFRKFFEVNDNNYNFVIIDLRNNSGGSIIPTMYMVIEFISQPQLVNANYYVLTDRTTFSSGILSAYLFDKLLNATVIGEPPSGRPNHTMEVKTTKLPNTRIEIRYPTVKNDTVEMKGNIYDMDYLIEPTFEEFIGKKDIMVYKVLELEGIEF